MKNFFEWFDSDPLNNEKPWLILGKGPSFSLKENYNLNAYNILALNHVVRDQKVRLAHAIDFDVVESCIDEIDRNAEFLVVPLYPHLNNLPSSKTIGELIKNNNKLLNLNQQGRILWYYKSSHNITPKRELRKRVRQIRRKELRKGFPIVPVHYFSAEAGVNLLAMAGIDKIRTLGIDGGSSYSNKFDDIKDKTLLSNGQKTFTVQFKCIAQTIMEKNLDYAPLNIESPIRIFVGSMEEQMVATKVLEYSVKKNCSMSVEIFPLFKAGIEVPMPKDPANRPRTPFSFQRFFIPQLKNFKGRAIYMDSDMQVFTDIKELWTKEMGDSDVLAAYEMDGTGRRPQFAVMLIDCEKLNWSVADIVEKLDKGELTYETLMFNMAVAKKVSPVVEREWNSLEHYEEGKTCNLHYTDMNTQPWLTPENKYTAIWVKELAEAVDSKFISFSYVKQHVRQSNIRPSLLYQLKYKNYTSISFIAKKMDRHFVPPHKQPGVSPMKKRVSKTIGFLASLIYF